MIIIDTDILSTFGKIDKMLLLFSVFREKRLFISPNVFNEITKADELGYEYAKQILNLVKTNSITMVRLSQEESSYKRTLPKSFGRGESDSIAVAKIRNAVFLTNEKKVLNFCEKHGVAALTLNSILRYLWEEEIRTKEYVKELIEEIEKKDKIIVPSKDKIFEE
ncbi:MAG TPA: hypothetical protein VJB08_00890 [Candidatus Nanoarchaeia archaeon]|nr:hypothetical protein [Candidatus Nanoarchaeia archaeon]